MTARNGPIGRLRQRSSPPKSHADWVGRLALRPSVWRVSIMRHRAAKAQHAAPFDHDFGRAGLRACSKRIAAKVEQHPCGFLKPILGFFGARIGGSKLSAQIIKLGAVEITLGFRNFQRYHGIKRALTVVFLSGNGCPCLVCAPVTPG